MNNSHIKLRNIISIWLIWLFISLGSVCYSILLDVCSGRLWWAFGLGTFFVSFLFTIYTIFSFLVELLLCFWIFRHWKIQKWKGLICCVGASCVINAGMYILQIPSHEWLSQNSLQITAHSWVSQTHNYVYRFASVAIYIFFAARMISNQVMLKNIREQESGDHAMYLKNSLSISLIDYPLLSAFFAIANPTGIMYLYSLFPEYYHFISPNYYMQILLVLLAGEIFSCIAYLPAVFCVLYMLGKRETCLPGWVLACIPFMYHALISFVLFMLFFNSGISCFFLPYGMAALTITIYLLTVNKCELLYA